MHGYDVVAPTRVNPELGGEAALERLVAALREYKMGLIADFVSNHMAVGGDANPWWLDVLEWGISSPYARFFDIQWNSHDPLDRKSTRLNSSHVKISYAVFCLKKKNMNYSNI